MTFPGHNPELYQWKRHRSADKMHMKTDDINAWRKRVETASEFAVSEVFFQKKPQSGISARAMSLQSSDQLKDHDDAYTEAQSLLGEWLGTKLRLELEREDDDDPLCSAERTGPGSLIAAQPPVPSYNNFDDFYNYLAEEEEQFTIKGIMGDLMKQEVLHPEMMEELALDVGQTRKKLRDPVVTMQARHQLVRENRAQREAARRRQQQERQAQQGVREEAKRREAEEGRRRKQEERRQEEMVQKEMVRLRRQMGERRGPEQLVRQRERERAEAPGAGRSLQSAPALLTQQQLNTERLLREQKIQSMIHMSDLKCLQRYFSGWYSVVLSQRLRMGKAKALCDWKSQLRAWRGWRAVVWAERRQREVMRTEEDLRMENKQSQLAMESDRRRLLRRCLNEWRLWCRMEKDQRELVAQQQETRRKMEALISAASSGKLRAAETSASQLMPTQPEAPNQPEISEEKDHQRSGAAAPEASAVHYHKAPVALVACPSQPWQVTRGHAAPTPSELHAARRGGRGDGLDRTHSAASPGARFENRHAVQQHIISQQRKLLKEQQDQIVKLKQEQTVKGLELEMEKTAQIAKQFMRGGPRPKSCSFDPAEEQGAARFTGEADSQRAAARRAVTRQKAPDPIITAMEARAQQRAERRKETEELKRKKELQKLAEMAAAEEQRKKEEEEEKLKAAEKRREDKRLEREREEEKQRQQKRQQELLQLARQHHRITLLRRRGLAPWKRLVQLRAASVELAQRHHNLQLLRRCARHWQQLAREALSEREASADQLHQHFLLRRSLSCWKRLMEVRLVQQERAERFCRTRTLRRFLLALQDHVSQERVAMWDRQELAREHNNRRVLQRCFLAWRQIPNLLRRERMRDERRGKLSRKVAEVLPDFCSHPQ